MSGDGPGGRGTKVHHKTVLEVNPEVGSAKVHNYITPGLDPWADSTEIHDKSVREAYCGAIGGDETVEESGCMENSGNTVQEATHDGEDYQPMASKVAGDSVVLDVDVT